MVNIFKKRFNEGKSNLQHELKDDGVWRGFKKEAQVENAQSQNKRRKVKDIFTE